MRTVVALQGLGLMLLMVHTAAKQPSFGPILPDGYVECGSENGRCACDGRIAYGAEDRFKFREHWALTPFVQYSQSSTPHYPCNNDYFGDPLRGTYKKCYCGPEEEPQRYEEVTQTTGYEKCADEKGVCACGGTILYGYNDRYFVIPTESLNTNLIPASDGTPRYSCTNGNFQDPWLGNYKSCYCNQTDYIPTPPPELPFRTNLNVYGANTMWEKCADEGGICTCARTVLFGKTSYGSGGFFEAAPGSIQSEGVDENGVPQYLCSKSIFAGTALPGSLHENDCYCRKEENICATEGGRCACGGSKILYGAGELWFAAYPPYTAYHLPQPASNILSYNSKGEPRVRCNSLTFGDNYYEGDWSTGSISYVPKYDTTDLDLYCVCVP